MLNTIVYVTHSEKTVHLLKFIKMRVGAHKVSIIKKLIPG